jgi:hypothetical protein
VRSMKNDSQRRLFAPRGLPRAVFGRYEHFLHESCRRAYLAGFFGSFFGAFLCGSGGVLSILRSTSSGRGVVGLGSCFMVGV